MAARRPASSRLCDLEMARKAKRGSDVTRSSGKNRKDHETKSLIFGHLHGDPNEDIWTGLSDDQKLYLSKSVVSITLCDGNTTLFSCLGIAIDRQGNHLTRFLTSASLVRNLSGTPSKGYFNVKINVCDEGNEVPNGFLAGFDLDHNFAVVNVRTFLDVQCVLQHVLKIPPHGDALLVALGRNNSGELITRTVKLSGNLRVYDDDKDLDSKISEAWEGGPLFSFDGNFVGMNLFLTTKRAFFLPWEAIFKHMERNISLADLGFLKAYRFGARSISEKSNIHLEGLTEEMATMTNPDKGLRSFALRARSGVLTIVLYKQNGRMPSGSGFVIKKNNQGRPIGITCNHVVASFEEGDRVCVRAPLSTRGVQEVEATIIHRNEIADVAILQVKMDLIGGVKVMNFANPDQVTLGSSCIAIGYVSPDYLFPVTNFPRTAVISPGVVRNSRVDNGPPRSPQQVNAVVICDCICCGGMSGGPVVAKGVIGVISDGGPARVRCVSVETIRDVLKEMVGDNTEGGSMNQVLARVN